MSKSTNDKIDTAIYLEIIKAISLHNNRSSFSDEDIKYAHQAKSRLIKLIKETLQELYPTWQNVSLTKAGYIAQREEALTKLEELLK